MNILLALAAVSALPVLPTEKERVVSLDGTWGFTLHAGETNGQDARSPGGGAETNGQDARSPGEGADRRTGVSPVQIDVPSNWEMRGFGTPLYDEKISGEVGVYRRTFTVRTTGGR